jgi:hypothetical protein
MNGPPRKGRFDFKDASAVREQKRFLSSVCEKENPLEKQEVHTISLPSTAEAGIFIFNLTNKTESCSMTSLGSTD